MIEAGCSSPRTPVGDGVPLRGRLAGERRAGERRVGERRVGEREQRRGQARRKLGVRVRPAVGTLSRPSAQLPPPCRSDSPRQAAPVSARARDKAPWPGSSTTPRCWSSSPTPTGRSRVRPGVRRQAGGSHRLRAGSYRCAIGWGRGRTPGARIAVGPPLRHAPKHPPGPAPVCLGPASGSRRHPGHQVSRGGTVPALIWPARFEHQIAQQMTAASQTRNPSGKKRKNRKKPDEEVAGHQREPGAHAVEVEVAGADPQEGQQDGDARRLRRPHAYGFGW